MADHSGIRTYFHEIPGMIRNMDFLYDYRRDENKIVVEMLTSHNGRKRQVVVIDLNKFGVVPSADVLSGLGPKFYEPIVKGLVFAHNRAYEIGLEQGEAKLRKQGQDRKCHALVARLQRDLH